MKDALGQDMGRSEEFARKIYLSLSLVVITATTMAFCGVFVYKVDQSFIRQEEQKVKIEALEYGQQAKGLKDQAQDDIHVRDVRLIDKRLERLFDAVFIPRNLK